MAYPLTSWTRPLSPTERQADIRSDSDSSLVGALRGWGPPVDRDCGTRDGVLPRWWSPLLPVDVPRCAVCTVPRVDRLCAGCKKLLRTYGDVVDTLEFMTIVNKRSSPESVMWAWKEETTLVDGRWTGPHDELDSIAAGLSAYAESHTDRLCDA